MAHHEWEAVWNLGGNGISPWWLAWTRKNVFVGTWTGPDHDLLCVGRATTNEEAERMLSPAGYTLLDAALRSAWTRWRIERNEQKKSS